MKNIVLSLTAGLALAVAGSAAADIKTCAAVPENRAIAESYNTAWQAALSSADPARIAALYGESAVLMPPSDETFVGQRPIAEYLAHATVPGDTAAYRVDLVSCEMHGGALHVAGVWGLTGSEGPWASGNLMRVLEATPDGRWIAAYEIWN
ncbi:MAG: DUF4440 domain-containing protein [Gammaproteobacteria bacterium]|nr:DUF4440 domain-containing protein [Gammaproteobacteria bacterium]MCP5200775.1 DUF4440 domain-containing protein [Gammaproteobacteria bacterium]